LVLPLFLDQILLMTVGIVATLLLSHAGEAAISAVSMVDMINVLLFNLFAALDTGGAVVVSQYLGKKDSEGARKGASQLVAITFAISLAVLLLVALFNAPVLKLLFGSVDFEVMTDAKRYFLISALSYPFMAAYNSGAAIFRSMGKSRVPMFVSVFMNALSVVGIALAIFRLHAGVEGVAWASVAARGAGAVLMLVLVCDRKNEVFVRPKSFFAWDRPMVARILRIAVPSGIENGLYQLGRILVISMVALFGTSQIAANGITQTLVMAAITYASAMNLAIVTVVGQCVGAGDYEQAIAYTKRLIKRTYAVTAVAAVAEILILPLLLKLYAISPETARLTFLLVTIHNVLAIALWPLSFTLSNALRAAGDVRFTMLIAITSMFGFRIAFAYLLGVRLGMGVVGVWLAMGLDWSFRALVFFVRFRGNRWKNFAVI
jgi:putative MATE family efflux protein